MDSETTTGRGPVVALVLASYVAAVASLWAAYTVEVTVSWWPAAGLGIVALLLAPPRRRRVVLLALLVAWVGANLTAGRPPLAALLLGAANTVEAAVVMALLQRWSGGRLRRLQDAWWLVLAAVCGAVVAGVGVAAAYSLLLDRPYAATLATIAPAHLASVVLIAPLGMVAWRPGSHERGREVALHTTLLLVVALLAFGPLGASLQGLGLVPLPLVVWAASRFPVRTVALQLVALAVVVSVGTAAEWGPFVTMAGPGTVSAVVSQVYLTCAGLIGLPLALAVGEREQALRRLASRERHARQAFTASRVPILLVREDTGHLVVEEGNEAAAVLLEQPLADLPARRLGDLVTAPDLLDGWDRVAAAGARGEVDGGWSGRVGLHDRPRARLDAVLSQLETGPGAGRWSLHLTDLTETLELQARLQAERTYTRAVIDTASSMILVTDDRGTVIAANPATTRMTGYAEGDLVGRSFWDTLMPEHLRAGVSDLIGNLVSLPRQGEATVMTRSGEHRTVVFSNVVHRSDPEGPVTLVLSATDVTDARESAGLVQHVLQSATTIAFVGTDLQGRITLFNTGAERLLGLTSAEAQGRRLVDFLAPVHDEEGPEPGTPLELVDLFGRRGGELTPETQDWTMLPQGRSGVRVSLTSSPVATGFGKVFAYLFVARDVTDTRRNQEILVNALRREREVVARLQDLDRAKDDFVSTVSHELRTPMSSIIGSAEMLADGITGELEPGQQQLVEVIARNGDRLLALADDLLLMAVFDREAWPAQRAELDLVEVVRESVRSVESLLTGRDLATGCELPQEPVTVSGDASHLERAVTNLLTNAVKFTPDGGRVTVGLRPLPDRRSVVVEVADTGLGIPEADLEHVFDRFFRTSVVQEHAIQGSGLGLSIVRSIVESHDGSITVRSRVGEGTTFALTLPLAHRSTRSAPPT
ncbi:hypothetical protein SAMN04488570_1463 [Nocardioides scoriae]|uniref:histidine kinase n=1 Tax=Nocardioides scoriae TaxID=642780 RepID=A0A1H1QQ90_9ACTN|nr:ATP-binding protein [Nocardioides scoriae]SDS25059.1 hypothetical protein SAMN04488570_1463 [Nocardioides scoriae]